MCWNMLEFYDNLGFAGPQDWTELRKLFLKKINSLFPNIECVLLSIERVVNDGDRVVPAKAGQNIYVL
jgi:hypothetical protein